MHRISLEILDRVQADFAPHLMLQLPPGKFGDQHLIFKRTDLQDQLVLIDAQQLSGDFGDQVRGWGWGTRCVKGQCDSRFLPYQCGGLLAAKRVTIP
jgi:hypothetical protein